MGSMMQFPDFTNKIILVYLMGRPPDDGVLLARAVFEIQGGRPFIIGEFAEGAFPGARSGRARVPRRRGPR